MFEIVQAVLVVPVAVHLFGSGTCHLFSLFLNEKELAEKGKRPVVDFFAWIRDVTGDLAMFCIGFLFLTILLIELFSKERIWVGFQILYPLPTREVVLSKTLSAVMAGWAVV